MMKNLRMAPLSVSAAMVLAALSALAYAPGARGQDFQPQPLPSFYAGQTVEMRLGEIQAVPRPPVMLVQDGIERQRGPWHAGDPRRQPAEATQPTAGQEQRPANYPDVPATAGDASSDPAQVGQAQKRDRVYDGLPRDQRQEARPHGQQPPPRRYPQPPHAMAPSPPHARSFSEADRLLHAGVLQDFLDLMKENYELKAQLKIQQIEFEAQQRIGRLEFEAEQQRHEAQNRLNALESMNAELRQAQQHVKEQTEQQTREMRGEMQELRRQLIEQSREMQRAQQSKAELEHRARAFEAQLEQMKANQRMQLSRGKQAGEERVEKREGARAQERDREREGAHDKEHRSDHGSDRDKDHGGDRDSD